MKLKFWSGVSVGIIIGGHSTAALVVGVGLGVIPWALTALLHVVPWLDRLLWAESRGWWSDSWSERVERENSVRLAEEHLKRMDLYRRADAGMHPGQLSGSLSSPINPL